MGRLRSGGFVLVALSLGACGGTEAPAPEPTVAPEPVPEPAPAARVFFVEPADGAKVTSPFKVVMGVEGMSVQPAGEVVAGTGHHHIIINGAAVPTGTVVPSDEKHIHFGKGQTETEVTLEPGTYNLRLQFADGMHQSYGEAMGAAITVEVVATP